ncbi:uncharacterized protein LOC121429524 [Lytechinus variegatus]|nr:uncharacterized protein LOC121429524 [Lytechinus variegatus]
MHGQAVPDYSREASGSAHHSQQGTKSRSWCDRLGISRAGRDLSDLSPCTHNGKSRTNLCFRRRPSMNWASVMTVWKRFRVIFVIVGVLCIIIGVWGQGHREETEELFKLGAADMDVESQVRKAVQPLEQRIDAIEKQ